MSQEKKMNLSIRSLIFILIIIVLLVCGATYAFWTWNSNVNKNVVFNTVAGIEDYVVYNEGNSYFIGNFQPSDTFCESVNTTISFYKKAEAADIDLYASIKMDVNSIGSNISLSNDVYWAVTSGDNTISCTEGLDSSSVLAYGTFNGVSDGQTLDLVNNIEIGLTEQFYTIWIWIDSAGTDLSSLSGETVDTNIWTLITMEEEETITFDDHTPMITSYTCKDADGNDVTVGDNPYFTYTGQCEVVDDGDGDWRIKFLTDGDFTSTLSIPIDVFLVGGGGGGGVEYNYGGGGGGGYATTTFANIKSNQPYSLVIGGGGSSEIDGENTTGFNSIAFGGGAGNGSTGGHGGSGGASVGGTGGSDGSNGGETGGAGQETSTREFGEETGDLYSGGGGGGAGGTGGSGGGANGSSGSATGGDAALNTGGGGGGGGSQGSGGGSGGSGIIVIRNTRIDSSDVSKLPTVAFDFTYDGTYVIENEGSGNWKIKFLTSGTFTSYSSVKIDAFLVGGGGGGRDGNDYDEQFGGGGGGGYTTTTFANIKSAQSYSLVIGNGGSSNNDGEDTTGFGSIAFGGGAPGKGGTGFSGAHGGSGGGSYNSVGGSDGSDGSNGSGTGGAGQETTTREFSELAGKLYAGGGGGGFSDGDGTGGIGGGGPGAYGNTPAGDGALNTGGGGGGGGDNGGTGGSGGSGIIVIRNTRIDSSDVSKLPGVAFDFEYTDGYYAIENEGSGNWKIKFLTSGTFISYSSVQVDAFLVGGGGGGRAGNAYDDQYGGGGGGGYTTTTFANIKSDQTYSLVIGNGGSSNNDGEDTTGFGSIAFGGGAGKYKIGGRGGSGGGRTDSAGGSDGGHGNATTAGGGGTGQETSTREFGEINGKLYSGGGGGGGEDGETGAGTGGEGGGGNGAYFAHVGGDAALNSGGGGGGGGDAKGYDGGSGGSGIIVIRNTRIDSSDVSKLPSVEFDFAYADGYYAIENEGSGNWKIKFLTSGTFTSYSSVQVDAFLVGGGGGGGVGGDYDSGYAGGGGGGYTTTTSVNVNSGQSYSLVIGAGGSTGNDGEDTTGFDSTASGGTSGSTSGGGAGGSGGGGKNNIGGSNGNDGSGSGGTGQGTTTREFAEETEKIYAGGGGGGYSDGDGTGGEGGGASGGYAGTEGGDATLNSGGGGGGGGKYSTGGAGGTGILIIRNAG